MYYSYQKYICREYSKEVLLILSCNYVVQNNFIYIETQLISVLNITEVQDPE